ncbi:hypothetical protein [Arsenicibacter rosenii]|uniref:hypothetical protein n=1 Tax=Arsenicibacter rosenii TaxID=1750698 RepID=UPI001160BDF3|nr:hypothetical protein [Arsenicibacter rosenii]
MLPEETSEVYNLHTLRFQFAEGLRIFQEMSRNPHTHKRDSWTTIRDNLATPDYVHDGFSTTYLNEVIRIKGDPQPDRKYIRSKQITLALYFISHYAALCRFDIRSDRGMLLFYNGEDVIHRCELPKDGKRYYLLYFWRQQNENDQEPVGYALLTREGADWEETKLTFSDPLYLNAVFTATESQLSTNQVYIQMRNGNDGADVAETARATSYLQLSLNVFHDQQLIILGILSGSQRRTGDAMAGVVALIRFETYAEAMLELDAYSRSLKQPPVEIQYFLAHQRLEIASGDFQSLAELPRAREVRRLQHLAGKYQTYFVHPDRAKHQIMRYNLEIKLSGEVVCLYGDPDNESVMTGIVRYTDEVVWLELDFLPAIQAYRVRYLLYTKSEKFNHRKCLLGIHTGLNKGLTIPNTGRLILEENPKPVVGAMSVSEFYRNHYFADHYRFLMGNHEVELNRALTDAFLREIPVEAEEPVVDQGIARFKGYYDCYVCDRHGEEDIYKIYRYVLHIQPDGQLTLARANEQFNGRAALHQQTSYLQIHLEPSERSGSLGTLLFSLNFGSSKIRRRTDIQHLFGVMAKLNNRRTEAMAVILHRADDETYRHLDISTVQEEFVRHLDENYRDDSDEFGFDYYDQKLLGGLSFLMGQMYRLIRLPRTPNRVFRPRKDECRRVNFYAACFLMNQLKGQFRKEIQKKKQFDSPQQLYQIREQISRIKEYLKEACRHGFAAERFAGYAVHSPEQKKEFRSELVRLHIPAKQLEELEKELIGLLEDRKLLINTVRKWREMLVPEEFAHDVSGIAELAEVLWPYIRPILA